MTVTRYGTTTTVQITERTCLWYGTWRTDPVRVILLRDTGRTSSSGYDLALLTTDRTATPEEIISRYAARWSIEVMFFDVKNILGVGQARNRVRKAVERTVTFGLFCHSLLIVWYALHGHPTTDTARRRAAAPWYRSKAEPSTLDMLTRSAARSSPPDFCPHRPEQPQPRKSSRSSKPGHWPPHNRESRGPHSSGESGPVVNGRVAGALRCRHHRPKDGHRCEPGSLRVHAGDHVHVHLLSEGDGGVPESLTDHLDRYPRAQTGREQCSNSASRST